MARTQRLIRLATAVAFICLLFADGNAHAENTGGVTVTVWNNQGFNASPPLPTTNPIGELTDTDIWHNFDQQPLFNLYEDFIVRFQSHITTDVDALVRFYAPADDGAQLFISNQQVINDWRDKGGGGSISQPVAFTAGVSQPVTLWFYENGGGAWVELWWQINDGDWEIVPDSAFTIRQTETTTTTTQPATTTTQSPTTTASVPTTNRQETSPPTVAQTSVPVQVPVTTDTTATTVPAVVPQPTQPVTTLGSSVPVATVPAPSTTDAPAVTLPMPTTTLPIQEPTLEPPSVTDEQILELIDNLDESTPEEIIEAVDTFIEAGITSDTALKLATSPALLASITAEQATEIFAALDITTLDASQADELVEAVQDAPVAVRESFEEQVNIFDGVVDSYVPIGSTVPISTRRLVIAAGALLSAVPVSSGRRN
jgi:hypothetical protein